MPRLAARNGVIGDRAEMSILNRERPLHRCLDQVGQPKLTGAASRRRWTAGFTLIELMIVITIILILLGIAANNYRNAVHHAREAVLKSDLQELRKAIDNYTLDKQAAPQSLDDLLQAKYLHSIPIDPITHQADWVPVFDNVVLSPDQNSSGMTDVHSNSGDTALDGTLYNTW
jgi:general secretion pathway protein G